MAIQDAVRLAQRREASKKTLDDTAARFGITPRQVCEMASAPIGTATFFEFKDTGVIPVWLEMWCYDILIKKPKRATNLLELAGGLDSVPNPIMGMSRADMHDLEVD